MAAKTSCDFCKRLFFEEIGFAETGPSLQHCARRRLTVSYCKGCDRQCEADPLRCNGLKKKNELIAELAAEPAKQSSWLFESFRLERLPKNGFDPMRTATSRPASSVRSGELGDVSDCGSEAKRGRSRSRSQSLPSSRGRGRSEERRGRSEERRSRSHRRRAHRQPSAISQRRRKYIQGRTRIGVFFPMWVLKKMFKGKAPKDRPKIKKPMTYKVEKGALLEYSEKMPLPSGAAEIFEIDEDGIEMDKQLCSNKTLSSKCE
jgi:hypothetical protein